jgi:hypothetical protein
MNMVSWLEIEDFARDHGNTTVNVRQDDRESYPNDGQIPTNRLDINRWFADGILCGRILGILEVMWLFVSLQGVGIWAVQDQDDIHVVQQTLEQIHISKKSGVNVLNSFFLEFHIYIIIARWLRTSMITQ